MRSISTKALAGMMRSGEVNARAYGSLMLAGTGTRLGAALRAGMQVRPEDDGRCRRYRAPRARRRRSRQRWASRRFSTTRRRNPPCSPRWAFTLRAHFHPRTARGRRAGLQTIFCADDGAGDDGRLHAYEILAQDLRGLELLTLSACETALGRYDLGDNLRGLPAAFFLAGVQTIVATPWPVEGPAAATFFPAFYAAIEGGASQRNAFAAAQSKTRSAFPQFRAWGAFYLMGRPT